MSERGSGSTRRGDLSLNPLIRRLSANLQGLYTALTFALRQKVNAYILPGKGLPLLSSNSTKDLLQAARCAQKSSIVSSVPYLTALSSLVFNSKAPHSTSCEVVLIIARCTAATPQLTCIGVKCASFSSLEQLGAHISGDNAGWKVRSATSTGKPRCH